VILLIVFFEVISASLDIAVPSFSMSAFSDIYLCI